MFCQKTIIRKINKKIPAPSYTWNLRPLAASGERQLEQSEQETQFNAQAFISVHTPYSIYTQSYEYSMHW